MTKTMEKFCIFDQDGEGLTEFDTMAEISTQIIKLYVDEHRRGKCYLVQLTDSKGYIYNAGVYDTYGNAAKEIKRLHKWFKKMKNQQGNFGFEFATDKEITPLTVIEILGADSSANLLDDKLAIERADAKDQLIDDLQEILLSLRCKVVAELKSAGDNH